VAFLVFGIAAAFAQVSFHENTVESQYGINIFATPIDLDEDGWMDMRVTDRPNDHIVWLRNDGVTGFTELPIPDTGGYLTYPYVDDLDQDGDWDIIGATYDSAEAGWWENDGDESFTKHVFGEMVGGHWAKTVDLDEGNGQTAVDGSPGDADGTITGATWVHGLILHPTSVAENGDDDIWAGVVPRLAAAPNPFTRVTSIALTLPRASDVRVTVHDLAGRVVREITDLHLDAGVHTFEWDGRNHEGLPVATGVYFCRATSEHGNASGKMVLLH